MFKHIFTYELKYWLKKWTLYLYILIFSGVAFLAIIGTAGFFDPSSPSATTERFINSPLEINFIFQYFGKILLFLLPAIIGVTIYKDYKNNAHSILYSFPIKKSDYVFGKFLSGLLIVSCIATAIGVSMIIAEHIPGLHTTKIGKFNFIGYLQSLFVFIVPNLIFFGAIVFASVTYFRNIYVGFVILILLFFIQNITENAFNDFWIALLDPFGQNAVKYETQFWSLTEQNVQLIPISGTVLYNRFFWLAISILIFSVSYKHFSFSEHAKASFFTKKTKAKKNIVQNVGLSSMALPKVTYNFSRKAQFHYSWLLSKTNFLTIVKSWLFYIIVAFGILTVVFAIGRVTNNSDMTILPVTNIVLTIPAFFFITIIMLLTFMYSGMLIHKDSSSNINQLIDATPISNFALLFSKLMAIIKMQAILLLVMMIAGIIIQIYNGYYNFEIDLYLFHLFVVHFSSLIIWAFISVFIHSIIRNTYLGIFMLLLTWLGVSGLKEIGINSRLLLFNFSEPMQYSDINGYANLLTPYFLVKFYWFSLVCLLLVSAYLFWSRGMNQSFKERIEKGKQRFSKACAIISILFLIGFVISGFAIFVEEQKSEELSSKERNNAFNQFEVNFAKYARIENQPKIKDIDLKIDIYPESNSLHIKGNYILVNSSKQPIDTLLIKTGFDEYTTFSIDKASEIIDEDSYVKFTVLKLNKPLLPKDSILLVFNMKNKPNTLFENNSNVLKNGTFFKNDILPRIGYFLNSSSKYPTDSLASKKNYYSQDSDAISLKTVISTSKNQTAIAPGYLERKWQEGDRNYFQYKTSSKIKNSLSFSSGIYQIDKEVYDNVNLEILHHKHHKYNLKNMKEGLKEALKYNKTHFGDYQFNEARIIEFPITEGTYASVMANSIPTSEMRFIANTSLEGIDISFYTIAHELTHQWFGNQLIPADAFGATMLSESITEYISLNIYEMKFGKKRAQEFLKMQHERYLRGRTRISEREEPLYLVKGGQQYLAYGKGTVAFNTLSYYLGKQKLHSILNEFLNTYKFKAAPYPTSIDFIQKLKQNTPKSLQYIIEDYFENITFYETEINDAIYTNNKITIDFSYSKIRNDSEVKTFNDFIEIAFYDKKNNLLRIESIKVNSNENRKTIKLESKPSKIIIDPNYLLIEKDRNNNSINL